MAISMTVSSASSFSYSCIVLLLILCTGVNYGRSQINDQLDQLVLQYALNLEYLETEFYLMGAQGQGLDAYEPELAVGGPPPIGARKAILDNRLRDIITQFGYQEIGHLRAIISTVGGIPRPLIDVSARNIGLMVEKALGYKLNPPFDPYISSINYLLACYLLPYVGLVGYVGANPALNSTRAKGLLAGLLAVESGQDAVIRTLLYEQQNEIVRPYNFTISEFTTRVSDLRNRLGGAGIKDEGLIVPLNFGAENRTTNNIISADPNSLGYARSPAELLRILYLSGNESIPGGFFPQGANGAIAKGFLNVPTS